MQYSTVKRVAMALTGSLAAFAAQAQQTINQIEIPAQPLAEAIQNIARQTKTNILVDPRLIAGRQAPYISEQLSLSQALERVLRGTGLTPKFVDDKTVTLVAAAASGKTASRDEESASAMRLADGQPSRDSAATPSVSPVLAEIIVTAQKRTEPAQEVPIPLTSLSAQTLVDNNQLRFQDYYATVPGLNFSNGNNGEVFLSIRGVTTGDVTNPTVGIVVDDVPYGSSVSVGGGAALPDIDPSDLASVEVLRGPQGTLYGASSLGGLLKFVTLDPTTASLSGQVQATASGVHNGDQTGYAFRGSVNVPLSNTLALRASGFTRRDPGYIDNVQTGQKGVNKTDVYGGRVSALWRPTENLSLKLGALLQDAKADGASTAFLNSGLGDLQQDILINTGGGRKRFQVYSANLDAKFGGFDLISVTGYSINKAISTYDYSAFYGGYNGVAGSRFVGDNSTDKFSQEIRLSTSLGTHVSWLLGAFYTHESSHWVQDIVAVDPGNGAANGIGYTSSFPTTFAEYAAFTDLTFQFTDRFDVQAGGRQSHNRQTITQTTVQPLFAQFGFPETAFTPKTTSSDSAFTYLLTPRFKVTPDLMVYARVASGYRPGGSNAGTPGVPPQYDADKTVNYELGVKGEMLDHTLTFDASVYYIDWKDIQLALANAGQGYGGNASHAKSQGVELAIQSRPLMGLTIAGWLAWNDAELTKRIPVGSAAYGTAGDRLPYSSRFSGNISVDQEFPLSVEWTGFVGGTVSYVGSRQGLFSFDAQRTLLPAYARTDIRAGVKDSEWRLGIFINNLADRRGVVAGGIGDINPIAFTLIQPRTAGLSISRSF